MTPLPQICEWAANEETFRYKRLSGYGCEKKNIPARLSLRRRGRQTGERPLTRPAAERFSTRQECVHTSRPTTSQRVDEEAVENTQVA